MRQQHARAQVGPEFRDRVKRLRLMRRWGQATLAERAGTNATTISQIEQGRVEPTPEHVEGIARALGYSAEWLKAELHLAPTTRPWLRAYADASKKEADSRLSATTTAAEYIRQIGLRPMADRIPVFDGDLEDDDQIEDLAAEMRLAADIDEGEVVGNAIRAAERLGCVVLPLESPLGRHMGMSVRADEIPMLCVAKGEAKKGDRQRWTVAHELGHLSLHSHRTPPRSADAASAMEKQANRFAAAFLTPGDAVLETLENAGGRVTLTSLAVVKSVWGVAIKSLVGRCKSLGVIDADHARSLYKQISARGMNKTEIGDVAIEEAEWFERVIVRKAGTGDLRSAANALAGEVGGNAADLLDFADWSQGHHAEVFSLAEHRNRK